MPVNSSYQGAATNSNEMMSIGTAGGIIEEPRRLESRNASRAVLNTAEDFNPIRIASADHLVENGDRKTPNLESEHIGSQAKIPQTASGMNLASPIASASPSSRGLNDTEDDARSP